MLRSCSRRRGMFSRVFLFVFGLVGKRVGTGQWGYGVEGLLLRGFRGAEVRTERTSAILSHALIVCSPSPRISDEL